MSDWRELEASLVPSVWRENSLLRRTPPVCSLSLGPVLLFPLEHPETFAHAGVAALLMTLIVVALQRQHTLTPRSLVAFLEEGICYLHLDAGPFWHRTLVLLLQK